MPDIRSDGVDCACDGEPALSLDDAPDGMPDEPPYFTFFRTKLLPPVLLELGVLDGLVLDVSPLDEAPARCRHPVTVVAADAESDEDWPVGAGDCGLDDCGLGDCGVGDVDCGVGVGDCGLGEVGLCAASVPHSATAVLSVTAHCH